MTQRLTLLELERVWLVDEDMVGNTAFTSDLEELRDMVREEANAASETEGEMSAAEKRVEALRREIGAVEGDAKAVEAQIETVRQSLTGESDLSEGKRAELNTELADLEKKLGEDRVRLGELRVELAGIELPNDAPAPRGPSKARKRMAETRAAMKKLRPPKDPGTASRIDELHRQLDYASDTYMTVQSRLDNLESSELSRIRDRFQTEVAEVASERRDLERVSGEVDRVSVALTRQGFGRMAGFFSDAVLKADMGIVDVYWARKLEIADERERLQDERNASVAELRRRFELIRQKMEQ